MTLIPLVIVGAGGFGREVAWLVEDINDEKPTYELLGFVDDVTTETVEGYPVLGTSVNWVKTLDPRIQVVLAVGDPLIRHALAGSFQSAGARFATLIHPTVRRSRWVHFDAGCIITSGTTLTTNIQVGAHSILNLDTTVGHDTRLGDFTSAMPGVHLSGDVTSATGVYYGTGAVVINGVTIGEWSIVGAGAVVSKDLPPKVVAVGVPAKPIRPNDKVPERR